MQFVVPQFIDVESKIIGPISVRQFIILLIGAAFIFLEYELFSFWVFGILGVLTLAISGVFAFVKVNSQPFHNFALSVVQTLRLPKLAIWSRQYHAPAKSKHTKKPTAPPVIKQQLSSSDVAELSLIVDTSGQYTPEDLAQLHDRQQQEAQVQQQSEINRTQTK